MKKRLMTAVLMICMAALILPMGAYALSPSQAVSQAYEGSVYYERLCRVELSGDWRRDMVSVALSQVGYHEGDSKADYAGGNALGWHNYIEYSSTYYGMDSQWCAMFVSWCARQAGIPKYAVNNAASAYADGSGGQGSYSFHVPVYSKKNYTPAAGDIVFFSSTGWGANHVGIVVKVTDTGIYTVEGNCMNAVRVKYYDFDDAYIAYYGVYAGQGGSGAPVELQVSELRFVYTAADHGSMPDGDDYSFDTLLALHGSEITIPKGAFVRQGHTLQGYFARREYDGAWYCGADGWLSEEELTEKKTRPALIADGTTLCFDGEWTESGDIELFCIWKNKYGVTIPDSRLPRAVRADTEGWINPFADMPESKWYYDVVRQAYRVGLVSLDTLFRGEEAATRAEFVDMLYRGAGEPETGEGVQPFDDVSEDDRAYPAVMWARMVGVTEGVGGNRFDPDAAMTRQEMTAMIYRWIGGDSDGEYDAVFADEDKVSDWAVNAMTWAVKSGIIKGVTVDGELYLQPDALSSRAQAVTVALRVTELASERGAEAEEAIDPEAEEEAAEDPDDAKRAEG